MGDRNIIRLPYRREPNPLTSIINLVTGVVIGGLLITVAILLLIVARHGAQLSIHEQALKTLNEHNKLNTKLIEKIREIQTLESEIRKHNK